MQFDNEFVVRRSADEVFAMLDSDQTIESLFPDTDIDSSQEGVRETLTHFSEMGVTRDIRFVFRTQPGRCIRFEKVCDGNVWRSLDGEIHVVENGPELTTVQLSMSGSTRALVPEFTIRGPLRDQLAQMTKSLRAKLENE